MAGLTISGLSSGIDTNTVINSTLALAAQPQNALKNQLARLQSVDSAYQTINSRLAALKSAADAVKNTDTWQATSATSSDGSVVASGSTTALAGTSTTFSVDTLAASQVSTITLADPANASTAATGIDIVIGTGSSAVTKHITPASNSASDLVTAVNAAGIGVKAALIHASGGATVLQFAASGSGTASAFTVSGLTDGTPTTVTTARDAQITVGSGPGAYSVTSSSNTFTAAIPGVTFTVSKLITAAAGGATVSVANDPTVATTAVQRMVDAANSALLAVSNYTAQGQNLQGDSLVNNFTQEILSAVSGGSSVGKSFTIAGLDITTSGVLTFDSGVFSNAYKADPTGTQSIVATDLAGTLSTIGDEGSNSSTGSLTQVISSDADQETSLSSKISDWDTRLAAQKDALTAKYAAMEKILSTLKSQQTYLTQAFAALTGSKTNS